VAFELYKNLKALGYSVLIDDRNDRFGSKIKDFELLGIPYSLVIGNKIEDKKVELINRLNDSKELLEIETILESLKSRIE